MSNNYNIILRYPCHITTTVSALDASHKLLQLNCHIDAIRLLKQTLQQYRVATNVRGYPQMPNPMILRITDNLLISMMANILSTIETYNPVYCLPNCSSLPYIVSEILRITKDFLPIDATQSLCAYFSYPRLFQFIRILHDYQGPFIPRLPIIVWRNNCRRRVIGEFVFHCPVCGKNDAIEYLSKEEIVSLRHGTTAINILSMLKWDTGSICINGYRSTPPQQIKDICPQGLIYFDIDYVNGSSRVRNRYANRNRYGAAVVKFKLDEKDWRYFKLGTKVYSKGYSQLLLATKRQENEWWLFDNPKSELHSLSQMALEEFKWPLRYCDNAKCSRGYWTHPEIVVDGNLQMNLSDVRIRFESGHQCINLGDGRRTNCIECDIRQTAGLCCAKINGVWSIIRLNGRSSEDISIEMFALSVAPKIRKKIKAAQHRFLNLFDAEQFKKILLHWSMSMTAYVEDWATTLIPMGQLPIHPSFVPYV